MAILPRIERERQDAALRLLYGRYSGSKFSWVISQKNNAFSCSLTRLSDSEEIKASSTQLADAIENVLMMAQSRFVHPPVKGG